MPPISPLNPLMSEFTGPLNQLLVFAIVVLVGLVGATFFLVFALRRFRVYMETLFCPVQMRIITTATVDGTPIDRADVPIADVRFSLFEGLVLSKWVTDGEILVFDSQGKRIAHKVLRNNVHVVSLADVDIWPKALPAQVMVNMYLKKSNARWQKRFPGRRFWTSFQLTY